MAEAIERALSLLGMARRAGAALVGQDQVLTALSESGRGGLLVLRTEDCSENVLRKLTARVPKSGSTCRTIPGVTRDTLGRALGVGSAQVVALPVRSGFAKKLTELLQQGGRCFDEQNQSI